MKTILASLLSLSLITSAEAAFIICTPGVVECNGTDESDTILVDVNDTTDHVIDPKKGAYDSIQVFNYGHVTINCQESDGGLIYVGTSPFSDVSATINCGDGNWLIGSGNKQAVITMGNGKNKVSLGPQLPVVGTVQNHTYVSGNGPDDVETSIAPSDMVSTGGGDDRCDGIYGNYICMMGDGNDWSNLSVGGSLHYGGPGNDTFNMGISVDVAGDKEIFDLDAGDVMDFSAHPQYSLEYLLPIMYVVQPPPPIVAMSAKVHTIAEAKEYQKLRKKYPTWKRERLRTNGKTILAALKKEGKPVTMDNIRTEFTKQRLQETGKVSYLFSNAYANPDAAPGDVVFGVPGAVALVIKGGEQKLLQGILSQNSFKFAQ